MNDTAISGNPTVENVLEVLQSPEAYVRGVLGHLNECRTKHGNALVRIGVAERSSIPDYRIAYICEPDVEFVFGAFCGDNHRSIRGGGISNGAWSSATMTFDEVQNLLGKVHGWKGKIRR